MARKPVNFKANSIDDRVGEVGLDDRGGEIRSMLRSKCECSVNFQPSKNSKVTAGREFDLVLPVTSPAKYFLYFG